MIVSLCLYFTRDWPMLSWAQSCWRMSLRCAKTLTFQRRLGTIRHLQWTLFSSKLILFLVFYKYFSQILNLNFLLWLGSRQLWSCWRWWWGWWGWRHVLWQWWVDVTTMMTPVQQSESQNYFVSENICHNELTVFEPQFFMICWSLKYSFTLLTEIFFLQLSNIFHMMCVHRKPGLGQFHMSWVRFHMFSLRVSDTDWSSAPAPGSSVVTVVTYRNQWLAADHAQDTQRQLTKYFLVWNNFQFRTEFSVYFTLLCSDLRDQLMASFNNLYLNLTFKRKCRNFSFFFGCKKYWNINILWLKNIFDNSSCINISLWQ